MMTLKEILRISRTSTSVRWRSAFLVVAFLLLSAQVPARNSDERIWKGTVKLGGRTLDVRLTVEGTGESAKARIDLVQARLPDFPFPKFSMDGTRVKFEVPPGWGLAMFRDVGLKAEDQRIVFEGEVSERGQVTGTLTLAHTSFPLTLSHPGTNEDQPYRSEDVEFKNGDVVISGSLLLPKERMPRPAVVLVAGSGGRTRRAHELEASVLAAHGVAALVYDKRGAGRSGGANLSYATLEELAADVEAAIAYLRSRKDINPRRIGIYGLSQGTWVGAKVSARDPDVAFAVAVSGSGVPLWRQEVYRVSAMMDLYGYSRDDIDAAREFVTEKMNVGRTGLGWDALQARMKALEPSPPKWYNEFADPPGSLVSARYWWVAFFGYDPKADLARTHIPVLAVFGARDRIVPPKEALQAVRSALPPNGQHEFVELPDADHSMLAPVVVDGRKVCQLVLPEYLDRLRTWIARVTR